MHISATPITRHRRLLAGFGLCVLVAAVAAFLSVYTVSLLPPDVKPRSLSTAAATTHVMVEPPKSFRDASTLNVQYFEGLTKRADLLGNIMAGNLVRDDIARRIGVAPGELGAVARITANVPATLTEPDSEQRISEIGYGNRPYRLDIQSKPNLPVLDVYAQAPSKDEAERLADAAVTSLGARLRATALAEGVPPDGQMQLRQLGAARGAVVNSSAKMQVAMLTFLVVLALGGGIAMLVGRARRGWLAAAEDDGAPVQPAPRRAPDRVSPQPDTVASARAPAWNLSLTAGAPVLAGAGGAALGGGGARVLAPPLERLRIIVSRADDWPRTPRLLPWLLAAFMALLWLVPFNSIALQVSLPIDLKLDRLVLPFVFVCWALALAAGGRAAPQLRPTWIHAGVGAFVGLACLSVVLGAPTLSQTLELDLGIKKLTLLAAYSSFFLMVASVVRQSEVRNFMIYILVLAVICGLGTIWEYRFQYNVFYDWADKLLPGIFLVGAAESSGVDEIGRRLTRGPAELGLEAVAMLSMALPIALVGILDAKVTRERVLYGLAAGILLAAAISTYRKSAFMAPIGVILTLAWFRPRQVLKLLPLGVLMLAVVKALSPGALGSIAFQLDSNRLGVATVSDRAADYDAIRPDMWANLAFGRGFGTYDHSIYRILDSEVLNRLVEMGVLGLIAYLLMIVLVIAAARSLIRSPDRAWAGPALAVAAAAVAFLVLSTLFDVLSFPHVPYIFLSLAGLLAVMVRSPGRA